MYSTKILLDSLAPCGKRLTTWELTYPRFIHSELMTHRLFSRNAASSRAIPIKKMIDQVLNNPAIPLYWGKNQSGMQAREELTGYDRECAEKYWLSGRMKAIETVQWLLEANVHKQIANRILEPWLFMTTILSGTEFDNFYALRNHPDAQPELKWLAGDMHKKHLENKPLDLAAGEWHCPLIDDETLCDVWDDCRKEYGDKPGLYDEVMKVLKKVSTGRCARVSYLTHSGVRDYKQDIDLHDKLYYANPPHMSPFEHVAQALDKPIWIGNFIGWKQYRKEFTNEHVGGSLENMFDKGLEDYAL